MVPNHDRADRTSNGSEEKPKVMTFFAILKDSIRESLDTWSLRILFVLSIFGMLIVATFSLNRLPAEKTMKQFFIGNRETMPLAVLLDSHKPIELHKARQARLANAASFRLAKVDQLKGEADAPDGTYLLLVSSVVPGDSAESVKALRSVFADAEEFEYVRIESIEELPKDGLFSRFAVTLHGGRNMDRIWACEPIWLLRLIMPELESVPLAFQIFIVVSLVMRGGEILSALIGVIITAFFIPNMLQKGSVDLMLVKPMARWKLITYKYVGGLAFMFFATAFAMAGIWFVLGMRTGFWANGLLLMIFTITFFFAILYAISTYVAVVTRSAIPAIMATVFAWIAFFAVGFTYDKYYGPQAVEVTIDKNGIPLRTEKKSESDIVRGIYYLHMVMPRTGDLSALNALIAFTDFVTGDLRNINEFDNTKVNWVESTLVSLAWIIFFVGFSAIWFSYKDY
jgi:ABC-type transport system involved in multi-copper enzyme maturation permease subunit